MKIFSHLANPIHPETIAKALGCPFERTISYKEDTIIFVYVKKSFRDVSEECWKRGIKTVGYWLGNDAFSYHGDPYKTEWPIFDLNFVVHRRLKEDLSKIVPCANDVGFLSKKELDLSDFPSKKQVAVYMPNRKLKYQFVEVCKIAESLPKIPFIFYGNSGNWVVPDNVTLMGKVTPETTVDILRNCSITLRYTYHDGFPQNIIESKMLGRHVVSNYPYDGCLYARDVKNAVLWIRSRMTDEIDDSKWPRIYQKKYSPKAFASRFMSAL